MCGWLAGSNLFGSGELGVGSWNFGSWELTQEFRGNDLGVE